MKNLNRKKISLIVLFIAILLVLYFTLKDDFNGVISVLKNVNVLAFLASVLVVFLSLLIKSLSLKNFVCEYKDDYSLKKAYKLTLITKFINGITPYQSAGQPFAIYMLRKDGVRIINSANALIKDFIASQTALIIVEVFAIIFGFTMLIIPDNIYLKIFVIIAFLIDLFILMFFLFFLIAKKKSYKIASKIVHFLFKFKIVRKILKDEERIDKSIKTFCKTSLELRKTKLKLLKCVLINVVYYVLTYFVPFVIFTSLGYGELNVFKVIILTSFVTSVGNFIPTPGSTGGMEYSFVKFFGGQASGAILSSAMLLWRFVTYALPVLMGFLVFIFERSVKDENRVIH